MNMGAGLVFLSGAALAVLGVAASSPASFDMEPIAVVPAKMPCFGTVDERFQSFTVEMVEVTGGRSWAPYRKPGSAAPESAPAAKLSTPGLDPALFRTRPPTDLANPRLRKLAAALGPGYVREPHCGHRHCGPGSSGSRRRFDYCNEAEL